VSLRVLGKPGLALARYVTAVRYSRFLACIEIEIVLRQFLANN
jgi:hypothetical protein